MLKRIFLIGLFTGAGQLYSVFVLKSISKHSDANQLNALAQLDSLIFFIMNVLAFGLQSAAIRNLALTQDWKQEYYQTQTARVTLSSFLLLASGLAFINPNYIVFILAPMLALSGDYALYARGAAVAGSFISFLRLVVPYSVILIVATYFDKYIGLSYAVSLFIIYVITNYLIAIFLKVPIIYRPNLKALRLYVTSFQLGLAAISLYFIGLGVILIAPYFYSQHVVGIAFVGLKFYMVYKGIPRIIHQAFVKEMASESVCLKVDQFSMMVAFMFLVSAFIFPDSFIRLFFGEQYLGEQVFFSLLAVAALIYSFFLSMTTRSLLQKRDKEFSRVTIVAALSTLVSTILLSLIWDEARSIALSLCIGELVWIFGLVRMSASNVEIMNRLKFLAGLLLVLIAPGALKYFYGDQLYTYITGIGLCSVILLLLHQQKLRL